MSHVPQPVPDERVGGQAGRALREVPLPRVTREAPRASRRRAGRRVVFAAALAVALVPAAPRAAPPAPIQHLKISGTQFVRPDGRVFAWRGITAFRLLEMEA